MTIYIDLSKTRTDKPSMISERPMQPVGSSGSDTQTLIINKQPTDIPNGVVKCKVESTLGKRLTINDRAIRVTSWLEAMNHMDKVKIIDLTNDDSEDKKQPPKKRRKFYETSSSSEEIIDTPCTGVYTLKADSPSIWSKEAVEAYNLEEPEWHKKAMEKLNKQNNPKVYTEDDTEFWNVNTQASTDEDDLIYIEK